MRQGGKGVVVGACRRWWPVPPTNGERAGGAGSERTGVEGKATDAAAQVYTPRAATTDFILVVKMSGAQSADGMVGWLDGLDGDLQAPRAQVQ